jgi:hypothetical protein
MDLKMAVVQIQMLEILVPGWEHVYIAEAFPSKLIT